MTEEKRKQAEGALFTELRKEQYLDEIDGVFNYTVYPSYDDRFSDKKVEEIAGSFSALADQVQEIINTLSPNYKQILILEWRYINGAPWEEISINLGLSVQRCYDLHDKALKALLEKGIERKEENE